MKRAIIGLIFSIISVLCGIAGLTVAIISALSH